MEGKLYKKVAQNLLALFTCAEIVLLNTPLITFVEVSIPTYTAPSETPSVDATYGQTLGELNFDFNNKIGVPTDADETALSGSWAWGSGDDTKVGDVGEYTYTIVFTPEYENYSEVEVGVTVNVSADTSKWGNAEIRDVDGKTQYVDSAGKTSVEISSANLDERGILWLLERSGDTSAWYGIDLSGGAFVLDKGLRFYVQWLSSNDPGYAEVYAQLDEAQKARVEGDNGWIFLIGVEDPAGQKVQPAELVKVYVQIGDDWDLNDLQAYYIASGGDENVPVGSVTGFVYPEGTDEFGVLTLSHFSPYIIFDELTDEEKAALEPKSDSTGDLTSEIVISVLAIILVSSLGIMLVLISNKKKFEE